MSLGSGDQAGPAARCHGALPAHATEPGPMSGKRDAELGMGTPQSGTSTPQLPQEIEQALLPKLRLSYQHPFSPWRRRYMVVLVSLLTAMLCADQNLLAPNLSAAAAYFNLSDADKDTYLGGYLMAAFFIIGAPAALLCGWLADKYNRVWMLFTIVIIGETPCLCTYWVSELWQFFLVRMLTGVAVGGCFPLVFSLLGDLFPITQRSAMAAVVQIAVGAGIAGGQMLAGIVGPSTNWRVPFVVMAAPSLLLAVLLVTTTTEPPRGGFEAALAGQLAAGGSYSETITWAKVKHLLAVPTNLIIILQGLPGCLPWGVMQTYINDYLHLNQGFSVQLSTVIILLFGIGCGVGVLAGGAAGQLLYNWRKESMAVLTGLSVLAGAGPVYFLVNANLQSMSFGVSLLMAALAGFLVSIAGPNLRAIMINVNTPETRGVSLALQSVTDDLGRGLGPVIVAGFISRLGRQGAFNVAVAGWVPCGLLLLSLVFTMRKDEIMMQQQLADKAESMLQQIRVMAVGGSASAGSPSAAASADSVVGSRSSSSSNANGLCAVVETGAAATAALPPTGVLHESLVTSSSGGSSRNNSPRFIRAAAAAGLGSSRLGRTTLEHVKPMSRAMSIELSSGSGSDAGGRGAGSTGPGNNNDSSFNYLHGAAGMSSCGSSVQLLDASTKACSSDGGVCAGHLSGMGPARHRAAVGARSRSSSSGSNGHSGMLGSSGTSMALGEEVEASRLCDEQVLFGPQQDK